MPRRKREIDNFLQSIDKSANIKFGQLYSTILEDLAGIGFDTKSKDARLAVLKAFKDAEYRQRIEEIAIDASVKAVEFPLRDFANVRVDEYIGWIKDKPYAGTKVTLSEVIRENAAEAAQDIQRIVLQQIKAGTNWRRLASEVNQVDKVGDVAKIIQDVAADGMRVLPTREARIAFRKKINRANSHIAGLSPEHAPTKQLKRAYEDVLKAVTTQDKAIVKSALDKAFREKINYNNDRVARTEIARAYDASFHARMEEDELVTGMQWELSSRHPEPDICDYYAELDTGSGPGIYSKDDFPHIPAHPNCLCMMTLYTGDKPKKITKKASERYLSQQSDSKRAKIIGKGNAKYRSRYIDGLEKHGVDFNYKPERLPKNLYERGTV